MKNEEEYIKEKMGRQNPFTVPDGYFESFSAKMMERLPEKQAKVRPLRRWYYAAACACIALFGASVFLMQADGDEAVVASATEHEMYDASYVDEAVDYAMVDNQDIYACLVNE